ncbi:small ribosomal subunit protein bS16m-like [Liolophura sinensis]|uniref:small ribosomal subunit protein bS16m-like n=1 Tax=Liolophura sinensis TaxID=3198878 RepID=UPI00315815D0
MKVAIRLALYGCANRPFYHIVAIPHRRSRNGRVLEQIGSFDPLPNLDNEKLVAINFERLRYWLASGAEPSLPMQILLGLAGFYPLHPRTIMEGRRLRLAQSIGVATEQASEEVKETKS